MSFVRPVGASLGLVIIGTVVAVWGARAVTTGRDALGRLTAPEPATAEQLLVGAAGTGMVGAGLWLGAVGLVCLHDTVRGRAATAGGLWRPSSVRRLLLGMCAPAVGAALTCGTGPAAADQADGERGARQTGAALLTGLPLPRRPVSASPPQDRVARQSSHQQSRHRAGAEHVVRPGESLWVVTNHLLGPRAHDAEVERGWRALYRVNRARVGNDPDLLLPGTRLVIPPSLTRVTDHTS